MQTIKILQLNTNRSGQAHDLLWAMGKEIGGDLLMVSEPNRRRVPNARWFTNLVGVVAMVESRNHTTSSSGGR